MVNPVGTGAVALNRAQAGLGWPGPQTSQPASSLTPSSLIGSLARGLPRLGETAMDCGIKDIWRALIASKNSGGPDIRSSAQNLALTTFAGAAKACIAAILANRAKASGRRFGWTVEAAPKNLVVPDRLSGLSPHRPTSPFPNHAAPQHSQNHFRSTR